MKDHPKCIAFRFAVRNVLNNKKLQTMSTGRNRSVQRRPTFSLVGNLPALTCRTISPNGRGADKHSIILTIPQYTPLSVSRDSATRSEYPPNDANTDTHKIPAAVLSGQTELSIIYFSTMTLYIEPRYSISRDKRLVDTEFMIANICATFIATD